MKVLEGVETWKKTAGILLSVAPGTTLRNQQCLFSVQDVVYTDRNQTATASLSTFDPTSKQLAPDKLLFP